VNDNKERTVGLNLINLYPKFEGQRVK